MTEKKQKRTRRTPDQIIADLEAEIERVRTREAKRKAKAAPEGKAFLAAVKALDKAIEAAANAKNDELERVLQASREPLSEQLERMGLKAPGATGRKRGRRRQAEAAQDITLIFDSSDLRERLETGLAVSPALIRK